MTGSGVSGARATRRIRATLCSFPGGFGLFIKRLMKNVRDGEKDVRPFDECLTATSIYQIASVKWLRGREKRGAKMMENVQSEERCVVALFNIPIKLLLITAATSI